MQIYKRSIWVMAKGLIAAPFAGLAAYIVLSFFTSNIYLGRGAPAALCLLIICITIFSENIHFELSSTGTFSYYKGSKLKKQYQLATCKLGYTTTSETGPMASHNLLLQVYSTGTQEAESDDGEYIDCSPIGPRRFAKMFDEMQKFTKQEVQVLKA